MQLDYLLVNKSKTGFKKILIGLVIKIGSYFSNGMICHNQGYCVNKAIRYLNLQYFG